MSIERLHPASLAKGTICALLIAFAIPGISCKSPVSEPDNSSPFLSGPGAQVTQTASAFTISWCTGGAEIAFTSLNPAAQVLQGGVSSVNVATGSVRTLDGSTRMFNAFVSAGDSVFYASLDPDNYQRVYVVPDNGTSTPPRQISRGYLIVVSPDRQLLASQPSYDTLEIVRLITTVPADFVVQSGEYALAFSPDSRQVLLSSGRLLNISDGSFSALPYPIPPLPYSISWTTNGLFAVLPSSSGQDTYRLDNLLTGSMTVFWESTTRDMFGSGWTWSQDGRKFAFIRTSRMDVSPAIHYLYVCDLQTGSSTLVMSAKVRFGRGTFAGLTSFAFSPDGKRIAYAVEGNIYVSDI